MIEIVGANNVPSLDGEKGVSDPFARVTVVRNNLRRCGVRDFPYILNAQNPSWSIRRMLNAPLSTKEGAKKKDVLVVTIYDMDNACQNVLCGEDVIGRARISVEDIEEAGEQIITRKVKLTPPAFDAKYRTSGPGEAIEEKTSEMNRSSTSSASATPGYKGYTTVSIRVFPCSTYSKWPKVKWLFFVRHGESLWNVAEEKLKKGGVTSKLFEGDHHLSRKGIKQAQSLNAKVRALVNYSSDGGVSKVDGGGISLDGGASQATQTTQQLEVQCAQWVDEHREIYGNFLVADRIYASPLARALQTSMVALRSHPTAKETGISLRSELREVKTAFGNDTRARAKGEEIVTRSRDYLGKPDGIEGEVSDEDKDKDKDDEEDTLETIGKQATQVPIHVGNTNHEWWTELAESSLLLQTRVRELLTQLKLGPDKNIILVSHSLLIKHLVVNYLEPRFKAQYMAQSPNLATHKIPNCGVVAMRVNFNEPVEGCIDRVEMMFGTDDKMTPDTGDNLSMVMMEERSRASSTE